MFPHPGVEVTGSENAVVTLNRLENKLLVNIINLSGPHNNLRVARYDSIPAIGPLNVKIKVDKEPARVTLQPGNIPFKYKYENGSVTTVIDHVDIHSVIVVE